MKQETGIKLVPNGLDEFPGYKKKFGVDEYFEKVCILCGADLDEYDKEIHHSMIRDEFRDKHRYYSCKNGCLYLKQILEKGFAIIHYDYKGKPNFLAGITTFTKK